MLRKIGRRIHEGVLFVAFCASFLARESGLIPIGDERYRIIRPEDSRIPIVGFSATTYFCLIVLVPAFLFADVGVVIFSPFIFFPIPLFLFTALICRMILESELRQAIAANEKEIDDGRHSPK